MMTRTPEQKARNAEWQREYQRKRKQDPEYRARLRAQKAEYERRRREGNPAIRARDAEIARKWRADPERHAREVEREYKRKYGLTPEQHAAMQKAQNGLCAICREHGGKKGLVVDHCHESGVVRGLLCVGCNTAIGRLGDNPSGLRRALKYLIDARKRQQLPLEIEPGE